MKAICATFSTVLLLGGLAARAQDQCGVVAGISYPVDLAQFQLAQDYNVPSPRHQGRYHTGEDYFGGRGVTYGQPVRAVAAGRVTYSAPNGWGRDGGVVIIEHTFPDGSVAYSQYGHMEEINEYRFPPRYGCVQQGDVVGAVGDIRPAPHLHFEIRINQPDVPGPGYSWDEPTVRGWRSPSRFIANWQTWLLPAHRWHVELADDAVFSAPPLVLDDGSLLMLDASRLRYATPDGRVLWRLNLERAAVAVTAWQGAPLLTYADGRMQRVNPDGTLGESWETGTAVTGAALTVGDLLVLRAPGDALLAFGADRRTPAWRLEGVPGSATIRASAGLIGAANATQLLSIAPDGRLLDSANLSAGVSLSTAADGGLLAYTEGGLWRIDTNGVWALALENVPPGGEESAAIESESGYYLWSGGALRAVDAAGTPRWQLDLPGVNGAAQLARYGNGLLLSTDGGDLIVVQADSGALCATARVYADAASGLWRALGADGVLRVAGAGAVTGLDWAEFSGACG
ncbi:MAG: M23 family metallopeptidase [Anaerolineae bacterium]|nr:M23 family metallopeptidase [Anaerolineae bacterium]